MTFLPIVERELRVAARLTATYRNRAIVAGVVTLIAMVMFAFGAFSTSPSHVGRSMFWTLGYLMLIFCLLEGVRKTADCLSEEKRDGTLGLLFLTDLKGYDVVLGKLAAKSLNSIYGLLSVLPVLALALLLGGVTGGEYWRLVLALANILFFSLCTGIWISCWYRDEQHSMTVTFVIIAVWAALPLIDHTPLSVLSPIRAFNAADARTYFLTPGYYWWSLAIAQASSWIMLAWASFVVPNCWREEKISNTPPLPEQYAQMWSQYRAQSADVRTRLLNLNPALWLASRNASSRVWMGAVAGLVAVLIPVMVALPDFFAVYVGICWVLNFAIKMRVAAQACHCLAEARRNNALEMLLATPLTVEQIIRGQILALTRTFQVPLICLLAVEFIGLLTGAAFVSQSQQDRGGGIVVAGIAAAIYIGLFALDICAVAWAGMWNGLSCKTEGQAVTRTILLVLVLPSCCMLFCFYGFPFVIGLPIMFMINSSGNLRRKFRELAGQRYTAPADSAWVPGLTGQNQTTLPPRL